MMKIIAVALGLSLSSFALEAPSQGYVPVIVDLLLAFGSWRDFMPKSGGLIDFGRGHGAERRVRQLHAGG